MANVAKQIRVIERNIKNQRVELRELNGDVKAQERAIAELKGFIAAAKDVDLKDDLRALLTDMKEELENTIADRDFTAEDIDDEEERLAELEDELD